MTRAARIWRDLNGGHINRRADHAGIFCVALLLTDSLTVDAVMKTSGLVRRKVEQLWRKAETMGLIENGRVHANWTDDDGACALLLDSLVLEGKLERVAALIKQPQNRKVGRYVVRPSRRQTNGPL